jgi:betaine-aldehyde dehydrogenase
VLCGDRATGAALTAHPTPGLVSITGSTRAGRAVARSAADTVKRTHLELGGKAPVVVFEDADLALAAEGIAAGGYFNAGQDCTAATRALVHERVRGDFVAALAEQAATVRMSRDEAPGNTDDDTFYIPPLNNPTQLGHVSGLVDRLPAHARVVTGGERLGDAGYFFGPTVIDGLRIGDELVAGDYGLASSVWTNHHARALRVSAAIDAGTVWVNCHIPLVAEMPHGGFKQSGYGKDLSSYSFEEYTRVKHVMSYVGR